MASLCSQMPNLTILMSNVDAACKQKKLSADDKKILEKYACEIRGSYCAGCAHLCEPALAGKVPISDVMRYLMYHHHYAENDQARALYAELPKEICHRLLSLDFTPAEQRCPQGLKIGKLMREAAQVLA